MFKNKEEFKKQYIEGLAEKYGVNIEDADITEKFDVLGSLVKNYAGMRWRSTRTNIANNHKKQLIYFSLEFLMGRLLVNNMQNLGIYEICRDGLKDLGIDINTLEDFEADAGLGNGGLGRLAACFLDSIASLGYPGHGNTLRYQYGFFKQRFIDGKQYELPDLWLENGNVWEVRKPKHSVEVMFYGRPETYLKADGSYALKTVDALYVRAMPYDMSVVGYHNNVGNTLRLWSAEPSVYNLPLNMKFEDYLEEINEICRNLYPDDSTDHGRLLRLKQEYFLVSAGLQSCMRSHFRKYKTFDNFYKFYVFQLNDTHPILLIPELMRLLMDDYGYGWDDAWNQVTKCVAYTNHTILAEALEKWPIYFMQRLLPRIYLIIEEINRRFNIFLNEKGIDDSQRRDMQIIKDNQVYMANMAIYACYSINGVAKIHTDILKKDTFSSFYKIFPEKFNNKTNGITHRRWFLYANQRLANYVSELIGDKWIKDWQEFSKLNQFENNEDVLERIGHIKYENKLQFANFVKSTYKIDINPLSIYDTQIKRLHAYKRQLMNIFRIMYFYDKLKNDVNFDMYPTTFIFGAKAAPSYYFAKKVIELINCVADVVNNDPDIKGKIKVVFVENYGVSLAEKIIPASDVSEQISTAGYEASGTSNMKFMMNGAVTLGTLDGANIEIAKNAGEENEVIFGLTETEVKKFQSEGSYSAWDIYNSDHVINNTVNLLFNGPWARDDRDKFKSIFDELMNKNDEYFVLKDLKDYISATLKLQKLYQDKLKWNKMCLKNIANSGSFSSDRTIQEYVEDIWHLDKIDSDEN
ncbi:MAG: glycogen/starch/alpha-glucan phosphorylase [Firmicutes bacterium]|nr:glycogen/starch/alpha-glucan phosphorylase [Candidatus Alectryobacillus merdavium]